MSSVVNDRLNGVNADAALKVPVRARTTANITLSGLQTLDGVVLVANDRVLVMNQSTASQNGIYVASTSSWNRAADFDGPYDAVEGTMVRVNEGTTYHDSWYEVSTTDSFVIGTDAVNFTSGGSAAAALASANAAAASASAASTSATNAAASATTATTQATNASASAAAAAADAATVASVYDSFDDRYLGSKASDPTLDNDGNALVNGALYFNTTTNTMKVYSSSTSPNWSQLAGGGATGGGVDKVFYEDDVTITQDYTITTGKCAGTFGPIVTIATGKTVTVPNGSVWTIV